MANIELEGLKKALADEGVALDEEALTRAFRKLANPSGCEHCGQHVKVGIIKAGKVVTACCGWFEGKKPKASAASTTASPATVTAETPKENTK